MVKFQRQNFREFFVEFNTVGKYRKHLSIIKWVADFSYVNYEHSTSQKRIYHDWIDNKFSHTISLMANTLFHKARFGFDFYYLL